MRVGSTVSARLCALALAALAAASSAHAAKGLPAFDVANRLNAYGTYLLIEQGQLSGAKP